MVRLIYGNVDDALVSGNGYFDRNINTECITTELGRRIIKEIDDADVFDKNVIIHPIFGGLSPRELAGGIKALFILMSDDSKVVNLAAMGDNCLKYLSDIGKTKDITVCSTRYRDMWADEPIYIVNSGRTVYSDDELYGAYLDYSKQNFDPSKVVRVKGKGLGDYYLKKFGMEE